MYDGLMGERFEPASAVLASPDSFKRNGLSCSLKRGFDVLAASLALLILLPALVFIAIGVVTSSRGPALFRQRRTGLDGRVFEILKFRTMRVQEDGDAIAHASRNDARVTSFGGFLRATSLDELPQLINVLRGDMALVGPRPHAVAHDALYGALLPSYADRFTVRPGLTGLAQILGLRGEIHELNCMARRVEADIHYAATWSFRGDILIVLRTVPLLLSRKNAY